MSVVLHITSAWDTTTDLVIRDLDHMGVESVRLNTEAFPTRARLTVTQQKGQLEGHLFTDSARTLQLSNVRSVYYRRPETSSYDAFPDMSRESQAFAAKESSTALMSFLRCSQALWVNHPDITGPAEDKVRQLQVAQDCGLTVPNTMVSNDPERVLAFVEQANGAVVAKTIRSPRVSPKSAKNTSLAYTHFLREEDLTHLESLQLAPCIFQEYVPKEFELRVTVVGSDIFAAAIYSQENPDARVDWRKPNYQDLRHEAFVLPPAIAANCIALVQRFQLNFAAIDLIKCPGGQFVFLECNPNGEWAWIQAATGLPISEALARLLATGLTSKRADAQ